jgi:hypothetical protein
MGIMEVIVVWALGFGTGMAVKESQVKKQQSKPVAEQVKE